jgi:hypothetical protein
MHCLRCVEQKAGVVHAPCSGCCSVGGVLQGLRGGELDRDDRLGWGVRFSVRVFHAVELLAACSQVTEGVSGLSASQDASTRNETTV